VSIVEMIDDRPHRHLNGEDDAQAFAWFHKAADQGDAAAQTTSVRCTTRPGVPQDYAPSYNLSACRSSASQGMVADDAFAPRSVHPVDVSGHVRMADQFCGGAGCL
jgi:TPR repeat protein